jgi:hypothetical protein
VVERGIDLLSGETNQVSPPFKFAEEKPFEMHSGTVAALKRASSRWCLATRGPER